LTIAFLSGNQNLAEHFRQVSRSTKCLIVITLGAEGAIALIDGEQYEQPSIKTERALDSTGCGDAFQAAFTVSYWNERNVRQALRAGTEQAARVLQHYGAIG
jgi:fructoselysine 6-kinase